MLAIEGAVMPCLNESSIQAVADGEATATEVEHVQSCEMCRRRVNETRHEMREFAREMSAVSTPRLKLRRGGSTTLRPDAVRPRKPAWIFVGVASAAVILALFVVFPAIDQRGRLNASEILNRSLATLSGDGVELLKYHLTIDAPRMAPAETGEAVIEQLIDHESGRWRFTRFAADGSLLSGIAEDPAAAAREVFIREGGRSFRLSFYLGH